MSLAQAIIARLSEFDFVIAIDTSGSMAEPVKAGSSRTRWEAVQESAMTLIRDVQQIDQDGLGLVLFGRQVESFDGVTADKAREVFASHGPRGSTPLAEALDAAFALAGKSDKKDMIIVLLTVCRMTAKLLQSASWLKLTAKPMTTTAPCCSSKWATTLLQLATCNRWTMICPAPSLTSWMSRLWPRLTPSTPQLN